ncbi:MAG: putative DNA ligase-like protein [Candidatus Dependentiae bacterium ADurb.Bin331]|nr:MAG: putative DNA ligase-like protein [Candidatus Dependentiae bacterium ADurb.Bin331]
MKKILFIIGIGLIISGVQNKTMATTKKKLTNYQSKRNFSKTPEPSGKITKKKEKNKRIFVIQKHAASHLHYDFRLEINGVLVSWAVPKGPPTKVGEKHLAIMTEDHPMSYAQFEGIIPQGEYGGGTVMVWDYGTFNNIKTHNEKIVPIEQSLKNGQVEVNLDGAKLKGNFALIKFKKPDTKNEWLMIKMKDVPGTPKSKINQRSALSKRTMQQIARENK